jgi:hypothetical protein
MLDELDHVAAYTAAAAIEELLLRIDGKPIVATTFRAWADKFWADAL